MGRRANYRHLVIWLNGIRAGQWDAAPGRSTFTYFDDWMDHPQGRPLSLSLPFTPANTPYRGSLVSNWFDNLLPDSEPIRRRLAQRFQTANTEPFELLAAIPAVLDAMYAQLPAGFPADVAEAILEGMRRQCGRLQSMPAA